MLCNPSNLDLPWDSTQWDDLLDEGESSVRNYSNIIFNHTLKCSIALRLLTLQGRLQTQTDGLLAWFWAVVIVYMTSRNRLELNGRASQLVVGFEVVP